jgi:hypothetical protein
MDTRFGCSQFTDNRYIDIYITNLIFYSFICCANTKGVWGESPEGLLPGINKGIKKKAPEGAFEKQVKKISR